MISKTAKFSIFVPPSLQSFDEEQSKEQPGASRTGSTILVVGPPKDEFYDPNNDVEEPLVDLNLLNHREDIFAALYKNYSSSKTAYISLQERRAINSDKTHPLHKASSLTYGEICDIQSIDHVISILRDESLLPHENEGIFYDVGSGSAKVVFAAALLYPFQRCVGIEILSSLHGIGRIAQEHYHKFFNYPKIDLYCGSILDMTVCDWTDGDVVYANSTCFSNDLFQNMAKISMRMKKGSVMITLSQILPKWSGFELFRETREQMSWLV